jgi:hypothetical protein
MIKLGRFLLMDLVGQVNLCLKAIRPASECRMLSHCSIEWQYCIDPILGSRTAHSRFNISLTINAVLVLLISVRKCWAYLRQTSLIIWDEAPMMHKITLSIGPYTSDIMQQDHAFVGNALFLWRFQVLLSFHEVCDRHVNAGLWTILHLRHLKLHLTQNMRLNVDDADPVNTCRVERRSSKF